MSRSFGDEPEVLRILVQCEVDKFETSGFTPPIKIHRHTIGIIAYAQDEVTSELIIENWGGVRYAFKEDAVAFRAFSGHRGPASCPR